MKNNKKERRCRYCGKKLELNHMFFCNDTCMEKFSENYVSLEDVDKAMIKLKEWANEGIDINTKKKDIVLDKCKLCKKDCKIYISEEDAKTIISFDCFDFEEK